MTGTVDEAEQLWIAGRSQNDVGQFADAAATLDAARRAASTLEDAAARRITIRIDITAALTDLELHGYAVAADRLAAATEAARSLGAPDLLALTHIQHGVLDARSARWAEAGEHLRDVLPLFDHIGPVEQCSTLITLGLAELSLCRVDEAQTVLEQAVDLARTEHLPVHLFKATHNLGCAAYLAGDLPAALRLMTGADAMPVDVARERAQLDLAAVLLEAGLVDQARRALTAAQATAAANGQRLDQGDALLDLARCAVLDDLPDQARTLAERARTTFEARQAEPRIAAAELLVAGLDVRDGINLDRALATADRWSASRDDASPESVDAALMRAEALLARGDLEACATALELVPESGFGLLSRRLHRLHVRARLADRRGEARAFADAVAESSRLSSTAQGSMRSLEVRAALAQHVSPTAQLDLRRALETGRVEPVFTTIERWRAASQRSLAPRLTPSAGLSEQLEQLRWLRSGVAPIADLDPAERDQQVADLEHAISLTGWQQDRSAATVDRPIGLDEFCDRLPPTAAYLAFAGAEGHGHAIVVTARGAVLADLGSTGAIAASVRTLRRDLRAAAHAHTRPDLLTRVQSAVAASAARLSDQIITPVAEHLRDAEQLVIAPNDLLHAVPWATLPALAQRPVTVAPSATVWARLSLAGPLAPRSVGAIAGPRVRQGVFEAAEVARIWTAAGVPTSSRDEPTSAATTATTIADSDIVHIAAHGHHAEDNPLFSSLLMADGPLFAHELTHGATARHVVLSACDVGRSRVRAGGEALGLTAALLALGVQSVIAAVAPISDEVSAAAAIAYHRELSGGRDAATALARAIAATPGAEALCCFGGELSVRPVRVGPVPEHP